MPTPTRCPDRTRLESCLTNASDRNDVVLEEHLESCTICQESLAQLAGTHHEWQVAQDSLANSATEGLASISARVLALSSDGQRSGRANADDPLGAHEIQQLRTLLAEPSHPELLGRIGRYEIEQLVGRGGMGLVFRAHDTELHRVVAIKTLGLHLVPIAAARERFIREARACAGLSHPHVVPTYDVITDGPIPALVMQYIAGPTLDQQIRESGPVNWQQALHLAIQLADALCAAHAQGLVHRDIKPGNVMLEADAGRALLMDFGLVRILDDATLTHSGVLAGTPQFMSPEQARGESVDERSDLFALGSLIYYMITGRAPFQADQPMAVLNRICNQPHQPLTQLLPAIPIELSRIVDQLLAKRAKQRIPSARQLRDRLTELALLPHRLTFRRGLIVTARAVIVGVLCSLVLMCASWLDVSNLGLSSVTGGYRPASIEVSVPPMIPDPINLELPGDQATSYRLPEVIFNSPDAFAERRESSASLDRLDLLLKSSIYVEDAVEDSFGLLRNEIDTLRRNLDVLEHNFEAVEKTFKSDK